MYVRFSSLHAAHEQAHALATVLLYPLRTDPMRNVSWMLFPGGTELGTQVKTGSRAGRTLSIIPKHNILEFYCARV